jgi:hypothetical protein
MRVVIRLLLPVCVLIFCLPVSAWADVGLPMIVPMGFLMIVALLPIIGVEAWVLSIRLDVGFGAALAASGAANAVSTVVGIPVTWLFGVTAVKTVSGLVPRSNAAWKKLLSVVVSNLFWLVGSDAERNSGWIIPSAELVFLVPFFFLSWWIGSLVVSGMLEGADADRINSAVFVANLLSYMLLAFVPMWFLIRSRNTLLAAIRSAREVRLIYEGITPDGRRMRGDQHGTIRFFDIQTGRQMDVVSPRRAELACEAVSSDGRFSLVHDERSHAVWDNTVKREICRFENDDYFEAVGFSPNAQYVAAITEGAPGVRLWSTQTGRLSWSSDVHFPGHSIAFSPDSSVLAVNGRKTDDAGSGIVYVWDLESGKLAHTLDGHESYPELKFSSDGRQLAVQDRGEIFIYRTDDWELSQVLEGKDREIRDWA